jgi:hypothetical protein
LPKIQELTVSQLLSNPETYESELIRIKNLRIQGAGSFASSTNYNVWDGNTKMDSTTLAVISSVDTELDDAPALNIPTGRFTFEGVLRQFCATPQQSCLNGYQLQGTRKADIIVQTSIGSVNGVLENGLVVYPNPASGNLFVTSTVSETINYSITDVTGRVIMSGEVLSGQSLNIADLTKGVYFFRTESGYIMFVKN